jgi:phosphate uptake regulator
MNMETRKVQKTGKTTLVVSLPKNWATKNAIGSGSILFISQNQNGKLVLSLDDSKQHLIAKLDIGNKSGDPLIRDIIACYIAGYRTIEISSRQMSAIQKKDLHCIVNKLIGPEILEETINKIVIHDLLNSEELPSDRALKRMKNMTRSMIQDAMSIIIKRNEELALDVMKRDNEVDRLNLLISRQFTEILRSGSVKEETINPVVTFNYMQAASNLERMADHASKIAKISYQNDYDLPADMIDELSKLSSVFGALIDDAISVLIHADSEKANELIDKTNEVKRQSLNIVNLSQEQNRDEMQVKLVIANSIERMLDYIINIAELAINMHSADLENEATRE